jgi:hypothetical protein
VTGGPTMNDCIGGGAIARMLLGVSIFQDQSSSD